MAYCGEAVLHVAIPYSWCSSLIMSPAWTLAAFQFLTLDVTTSMTTYPRQACGQLVKDLLVWASLTDLFKFVTFIIRILLVGSLYLWLWSVMLETTFALPQPSHILLFYQGHCSGICSSNDLKYLIMENTSKTKNPHVVSFKMQGKNNYASERRTTCLTFWKTISEEKSPLTDYLFSVSSCGYAGH